jgi:FG-GAP repeat
VFVVVERLTDPEGLIAGKGDYSVVFMRRMVAGELRTFVVAQWIADSGAGGTRFVQAHDLDALADLNGDGRMEVVVGYRYYEGAGTAVYEVAPNGGLVQVLHRGCGV